MKIHILLSCLILSMSLVLFEDSSVIAGKKSKKSSKSDSAVMVEPEKTKSRNKKGEMKPGPKQAGPNTDSSIIGEHVIEQQFGSSAGNR